jgi:hypothetical protein
VGDISALARSLRGQLLECERTPGHVELLNMLARSSGFRNFQHFRAQAEATAGSEKPDQPPVASIAPKDSGQVQPEVDQALVTRAARYFDAHGRMIRWPGKHSHRIPCLWVLWSRLPANQDLSEKQVNELLAANHLFEDHALLRRFLCDHRLVDRTADGRRYRRIEQEPSPEALALIRSLGGRRTA